MTIKISTKNRACYRIPLDELKALIDKAVGGFPAFRKVGGGKTINYEISGVDFDMGKGVVRVYAISPEFESVPAGGATYEYTLETEKEWDQ